MIGSQAYIFVHVEHFHALPIDLLFRECIGERELRVSGGDHQARFTPSPDRFVENARGFRGRRSPEFSS